MSRTYETLHQGRRGGSRQIAGTFLAFFCGMLIYGSELHSNSALSDWSAWSEAVYRHFPGESDTSTATVAAWPTETLERLLRFVRSSEFRAPADFRFRATVLHTDVAVLHRTAAGYGLAGKGRPAVVREDGSAAGTLDGTWHWEFLRQFLTVSAPPAGTDTLAVEWYRASSAFLQSWNEYSELVPHLNRGRQLFPRDPFLLLYAGTMHEAYAEPRIQVSLVAPRSSGGLRPKAQTSDVPLVDGPQVELNRAERLFREALAIDSSIAEARVRRAQVLGRLGRHHEAARELRAVEGLPRPGEYWRLLILGREELASGEDTAAVRAYERAVELFPGAQSAQLALSHALHSSGDKERSTRLLDTLRLPLTKETREDPWWNYNRDHVPSAADLIGRLRNPTRH